HTRFSRDWSSDVCSSDLDEHIFITDIHEDNYADALYFNPARVVTYAQRITDLDGRKLGWVLIDLDYSFVTKMLERLELWDQGQRSEERRVGKGGRGGWGR